MAVKVTVLNKGDVVQADDSWCVARPAQSGGLKTLWVRQNYKTVEDTSSPYNAISSNGCFYTAYPKEEFIDMSGPAVSLVSLLRDGDFVRLDALLSQEGISVRGKNFLVVEKERVNTYNPPEYKYTAHELDANHEVAKGGLTVLFQQRSEFCIGGDQIFEPKIIGRREPTFAPFKPA